VFVGAGPGAPDLLTGRAVAALAQADAVVHDRLVPPEILDLVGPAAERIAVPGTVPAGTDRGDAVGQLLVSLAGSGRHVVRLKGGDPGVFARLAEELDPLREAGILVEFVPGVTAALAAAAAAGIPLTSRAAASSLTLVTGHEADEKSTAFDFAPLAAIPGTLAVYMGVEQAGHWSRALLEAGLPATTPVTIVSRCSWPDQRIAASTLGRCATDITRHGWQPPAVIIVGAAGQATLPRGPLAGRVVLVTRPAGQAGDLAALVRDAGGECVHVPLVSITAPDSWQPLDAAMHDADRYDWIVFASVNGVRAFLERLHAAGRDGRSLGTARLAAIGPATRRSLEAAGFVPDLAPDTFRSEGLVDAFLPTPVPARFLLVRASQGRDVLRRELESRGHVVDEVAAYRSHPRERLEEHDLAALDGTDGGWITVTSGLIAETAIRLFGDRMRRWRIASLSPVTSDVLRHHGFEPAAEAATATMAGLVAAIVAAEAAAPPPSAGSAAVAGAAWRP
jgi:uroporphyrinogen III methyltransferase/synthase